MTKSFIEVAVVFLTIAGYVGGFFPAYYFAKCKLGRNLLLSFLLGMLGLLIWDFFLFVIVEYSIHIWRNNILLLLLGCALVAPVPYLLTFLIVRSNSRATPSESSQK